MYAWLVLVLKRMLTYMYRIEGCGIWRLFSKEIIIQHPGRGNCQRFLIYHLYCYQVYKIVLYFHVWTDCLVG